MMLGDVDVSRVERLRSPDAEAELKARGPGRRENGKGVRDIAEKLFCGRTICASYGGCLEDDRSNMTKAVSKLVLGGALCLLLCGPGLARAQHDDHHGGPPQAQNGHGYHFQPQDRDQLRGHYESKVRRYRGHDDRRAHYSAGQRLSTTDIRHFQRVPSSYSRRLPPPPRGYRFGYYQGNVVAYNPTTRIIADVLDLVTQ
jgi:Ni/Co efflux regulator RcnB